MNRKLTACILAILIAMTSNVANAEKVEINLKDKLDGILSEYCLDIAGGNQNVDTSKGLQAHTCYSYKGSLGTDQVFDTEKFADNVLYMPEYDVCATLESLKTGAKVNLASCDGSALQTINFSAAGTISPVAAPTLCFTAGESTRMGRGGTSQHQIKSLTLEVCSDALASSQNWSSRTKED